MNKKRKRLATIIKLILEFITFIIMIRQLYLHNWFLAFTCLYTIIIMGIPRLIDKKYKIRFPSTLEILIYAFTFCAEILGEIGEYYVTISWWDDLLHIISGFGFTGVGVFFIELLNNSRGKYFSLSPFYVAVASFCFAITILTLWEFFEYGMDTFAKTDMQKDTIINEIHSVGLNEDKKNKVVDVKIESLIINGEDYIEKYGGYIDIGLHDTMIDLIDGFIGSSIFSIFVYFYIKRKDEKSFVTGFIPKLGEGV